MESLIMGASSFALPEKYRTGTLLMVALGLLCASLGFWFSPVNTWLSLYLAAFYFLTASLFGPFILAVANVSGAAWLVPYKSIAESMGHFVLPGGIFFASVALGGASTLFEWTHPAGHGSGHGLGDKTLFLNLPFFVGRMFFYIVSWWLLSRKVISLSRDRSTTESLSGVNRQVKWSVIFLIAFALTFSFASFDWVMALEPHFFSTIFGIYSFAGFFVAGLAVLTLSVVLLDKFGYLGGVVNENHYHDLGKLIFGFSTFWAYIWLSQFLLIWYTNIPEESVYYLLRTTHDWDWLFYFSLFLNWVVPFFFLLPRNMKRSPDVLVRVSIVLLIGRWFDLFILMAPKVFENTKIVGPSIGWIEVGTALGVAGAFILVSAKALSGHRLIAKEDAFFEEGVHLTQ